MQVINSAKGKPIAILNRNQPVFYCVSPSLFEMLMEKYEEEELVAIVKSREGEKEIEVNLDDL